jgi:phospholipid/cholesterol/gamma-HCH transport system substrate-binding protein
MKRILLSATLLLAIGAFVVIAGGASSSNSSSGTYKIELDNAFGLVTGAQFKVAGVPSGTIETIELCAKDPKAKCQNPLHAVVTVSVTSKGFTQFRSDAFCQSRPESLIGEYFIECQPGQSGQILKSGSTIPVTHTESTIPADLLADVMRMPYRERLTLIINELGAAVAGRSGDLQAALQRAVPALTQTDNLLNLLANDSNTLQSLTSNSDAVITALANNSGQVQRFITEANNAATDTATQSANLQASLHDFPGFLEQLKPAMQKLQGTVVANEPVLANLNAATGHLLATTTGTDQLHRLFTDLVPFSHASLPAIKALGKASVTGKPAVIAARPTVYHLNQFAKPTPELAQNLAIVLQDMNTQKRAVEPDTRSPGGKGFSGLQALLQYVFNQTLAVNAYSNFGHLLTVDAFMDPRCAPYATQQSVANGLAQYGASYRQCYAWLGPNQPGINETDPSNPRGCVPDPGGAPPGLPGPKTTACKLPANSTGAKATDVSASTAGSSPNTSSTTAGTSSTSGGGGGGSGGGSSGIDLQQKLGQLFSALSGGGSSAASSTPAASTPAASTAGAPASGSSSNSPNQAKQLLNYLLAP